NVINIVVYLKLGLKDSISICFFVLSCTDLVSVMLVVVGNTFTSLSDHFQTRWRTDGASVMWVLMAYYGPFYDISQGITTYIAVQKCWCVALPFRFKNTFTRKRTAVILTGISLALFAMHLPILASQSLAEMFDPVNNKTIIKLWAAENLETIYSAVSLVSLVFTNTCQFTVIFCLIVLASSLRASSKFRNATIASTEKTSSELKTKFTDQDLRNCLTSDEMRSGKHSKYGHGKITGKKSSGANTTAREDITPAPLPVKTTSRKELLAIKSTTMVSTLFVSFNTLKLLNYYALLCIPEYGILGRYSGTYLVTNEMRITLEVLHCSCNMFIYLKFNTRYRSTLLASCGRSR
ncbi:unnamed protein product, partial [Lymnaea stagnalis]